MLKIKLILLNEIKKISNKDLNKYYKNLFNGNIEKRININKLLPNIIKKFTPLLINNLKFETIDDVNSVYLIIDGNNYLLTF
jgi:hypothetical protein